VYLLINGTLGLLWVIGIPAWAWLHLDWPAWLKGLAVLAWLLPSGPVVDRWIPRLANPVIEWFYALVVRR
jgi:hypothetical protein